MQEKYTYPVLGLFIGAIVNVILNLIAAAIQQRAISEKFNDRTILWMVLFAIVGLLAGYWLSLKTESPNILGYRGGIKAKGVTSREGRFVADERTGQGIDAENIRARDDVILSSSNAQEDLPSNTSGMNPTSGLAAQALNAGGNITIQQFVGNQATLIEQFAFFSQQIGITNPKQAYANSQFEAYCNVWKSLQALRLAGDDLWERASEDNLLNFANQLRSAKQTAHEGEIFFEEEDLSHLNVVLRAFSQFRLGKTRLVNIRSKQGLEEIVDDFGIENFEEEVDWQIRENHKYKLEYEKILNEIRKSFNGKLSR
ncbi:hypothetical protein [Phormidium tenue]|uniref:Uncharacterized protein n=1 Tax=Phormidium tenue NIES-30 TaxID=549789 RepID=A0A1U7J3Q8_9CYAN|nr:hypothetical protein [Phormidium tenue]MBD2233101.1 hypothetical protein [Phormidium tenue FACHB-1052]OKH47094.1 hypothetical protein NIES30_13970 [Phormidium tenue NIES-30]